MKSDKLIEATLLLLQGKKLQEAKEINQNIEVNVTEVINQGIQQLKEHTNLNIQFVELNNDKVVLNIQGNSVNLGVLKDLLNMNSSNELEEDDIANKLKRTLTDVLSKEFTNVNVKLVEIVRNYVDMGTIKLEVNIDEIPYKLNVTYNVFDNGELHSRVTCYGDRVNNETWSYSVRSNEELVEKVKQIATYYNNK